MATATQYHETQKRIIGKNLRHFRLKRGWTQEELAARLKTCQAAISFTEAGRRMPLPATLDALARTLGISIGLLINRRKPRKK